MNPLSDLLYLFVPPRCAACGGIRGEGSRMLCLECSADMPSTGYARVHDNPVYRKLSALIPIEQASSLFFYTTHSPYRLLIHNLKYHGAWKACMDLGHNMGRELREGGLYHDIDVVAPVPLHFRRMFSRGYNQAAYIAEGISKELGKPLDINLIKRTRHNPSQTKQAREGRWENVHGIFSVPHRKKPEGKHILLVDDVLTTGATIAACAGVLLAAGCRVSVATLAASTYELFPSKP